MNTANTSIPIVSRRNWTSSRIIESVRFWERGRLAYNGVLLLLTAVAFLVRWPESRFLYTTNLGSFFSYVIIANILQCSIYSRSDPPDSRIAGIRGTDAMDYFGSRNCRRLLPRRSRTQS